MQLTEDPGYQRLIKEVESMPRRRGKREYLIFLRRERRLKRDEAIKAKCYDCCNFYYDQAVDCGVKSCALYTYTPYRRRGDSE
ncbi:hypothetical protein J2T61_000529 [Methanocalculus sp. AMF5]|uniref:hypothetical protein n=1 Tax=Methanocalculus sp. AMF5 TaxID=1198257 RepID=UPI00209DD334|nr:hypothetical protein [Methanocalculus sp. AMF5]MCP1661865.1 hypothetical protein [Methanocalculus sp. AMF5]